MPVSPSKLLSACGLAVFLSLASASGPALGRGPDLPTAADFGRAEAIGAVVLSPDGKHIAAITSPDGKNRIVSVWNTEDPSKAPSTIAADPRIRFLSVAFIKNDRLVIEGVQPYTEGTDRRHVSIQFITTLDGSKQTELLPQGRGSESEKYVAKFGTSQILDPLRQSPTDVIVMDTRLGSYGDIFRVNVYTGASTRLERGSDRYSNFQTDLKGEIRAKQEINYDNGQIYIAQWIKNPTSGEWEEHFRWYAKDRVPQELIGFSPDPNIVYIRSSKDSDNSAIYEYDVQAKKLLDPIFAFKMFESEDIIQSHSAKDYGQIIGFTYNSDKEHTYWVDGKMAELAKGMRDALGVKPKAISWTDQAVGMTAKVPVTDGVDAQIISVSEDRKVMLVEKSGPNLPPEYYLLRDSGQLILLGKSRPWLNTEALGESRLVQYPARDGMLIPAFLTLPPASLYGPGPYPTIIEPHGGPWARDENDWDISGWTQYFASRGFAVLRPQFRGSEGWGQRLWRAGDAEWGQKMQDDKDDGVKWLIDQKIAAPDRVAIFGYSYGGYAALAAAIRPNGLYQCAISGAGAGDLASIGQATFDNRFQREFQHPTIKGLDALAHASEASIPVFLYHGDRDTTVDIKQSRKFAAILKDNNKPYKMLEIKDMGHQYVFMSPDDLVLQLNEVESFLRNDCGPGGI